MLDHIQYPSESIISYAQTHEDVLLWRAFHHVKSGFYIDIGARDPVSFSVTKAFYDRGWNGINVDPVPHRAEKFRRERPRDKTFELALGKKSGTAPLSDFHDPGAATSAKRDRASSISATAAEHRVTVVTLSALLSDCLDDREVHFLKITTGGHEADVLEGADFLKIRPWIILIESIESSPPISSHEKWENFLFESDYEFAYFDGINRYYVSREHRDLRQLFSVPVNTRDPFRDYEFFRLSNIIIDLERDKIKHEIPRLGGNTSLSCDISDADGLRQIVQEQARDLLRLRRLLVESQSKIFDTIQKTQKKSFLSKNHFSSYEDFFEFSTQCFIDECKSFAVDAILDVGANSGQFAGTIRKLGYKGHIISFEPLSEAHAALISNASSDPLWDVVDRCAVGSMEETAEINIAGNSYSSSLLPMLDLHREAAPQSEYIATEQCPVITLDAFVEQTFSDPTTLFGLKIDTQGYEAEVLEGARRNRDKIKVIVCEMSVAPLYAHGPTMSELCHLLAELGYRCVALSPEFEDPRTRELLQVNGVFIKA